MLGITMMLGAWLVFSFIDAGAKWLSYTGLAALQLAFMRYAAHFVISFGLIAKDGISPDRFIPNNPLIIVRAAMLVVSTVANFIALQYLPLSITATILFSSPIIICLLSGPLLKEKVGPWRWSAIILGFLGIIIAMRPFGDSFHWAMILSLCAASGFAGYSILTRYLANSIPTQTLQFHSGLIGIVALAPFAVSQWKNPDTMTEWIIMISLGVFGWLGHQLLTKAHQFASASTLTPYAYSFIIYLTIWSYMLFGHIPDKWTVVSAAIIITAGVVIWIREKQTTFDAK